MDCRAAGIGMERRAKWGIGIVLAGFLAFLFLQFSHVWIYFDDYGYLSLSYGQDLPGVEGANYTLRQLFSYLKLHYYLANGRLLYTGLFPLCNLIGGIQMVQAVMALAVFAVHAAAVGLVLGQLKKEGKNGSFRGGRPVLLTAFICLLFGCIGLDIQNSGTYWYAASFTYVIPVVCLFFFLYLYSAELGEKRNFVGGNSAELGEKRNSVGGNSAELGEKRDEMADRRKRQWVCVILAFFCAFSQEQWISALVGCLAVLWISWLVQRKRPGVVDVLVVFAAGLGAFPVLSSPAVRVRMNQGTNAGFTALSLMQKLRINIPGIIRLFFSSYNEAYLFVFLAAMLLLGLYMLHHRIGPVPVSGGFAAAAAVVLGFCLMNSRIAGRELGNYPEAVAWLLFAYVLWMSWQVLVFLHCRKAAPLMLIYLAAFFSIACLCIVPEQPVRVLLPFIYLSYPVLGYVFAVLVLEAGSSFAGAVLTVCLAVCSVSGLSAIYRGYAVNDAVIRENDQVLRESAQKFRQGETVERIELRRLPDDGCRNFMPYDEDMYFLVYWMAQYYGFSPDIPVIYH